MVSTRNEGQSGSVPVSAIRAVIHEMNNVLTPLVATTRELADAEADPERRRRLQTVLRSGRTIARLVRALRSPDGLLQASFDRVMVLPLLRSAVEELEPLVREQRLTVILCSSDEAAKAEVVVDPELIRRLVVNLIRNAIQVSPRGGTVVLGAECRPDGVRVSVGDEGPGLPCESLDRLPEGFTTRAGDGHGTGLTVCRAIAKTHGTSLTSIHSDSGTEVAFSLRALQPAMAHREWNLGSDVVCPSPA